MDSFDTPPEGFDGNVTTDEFLGGRLSLHQPQQGFRGGLDSVLLAAALPRDGKMLLELGAGSGVAACCALRQRPEAKAWLIERQAELMPLLDANLRRNGLRIRAELVCADLTVSRAKEFGPGAVPQNQFDVVFANPPFFEAGRGTPAGDRSRRQAHQMGADELENWARFAAGAACKNGHFVVIHTAPTLQRLLSVTAHRFGRLRVLPIYPREGQPASRVLVSGIKGSRAPMSMLPPLVLHDGGDGQFSPRARSILMGEALLDW